jgi:hypothetical protein
MFSAHQWTVVTAAIYDLITIRATQTWYNWFVSTMSQLFAPYSKMHGGGIFMGTVRIFVSATRFGILSTMLCWTLFKLLDEEIPDATHG